MHKFKSIGIVLYDDFNSLDVAGPYQVFLLASVASATTLYNVNLQI